MHSGTPNKVEKLNVRLRYGFQSGRGFVWKGNALEAELTLESLTDTASVRLLKVDIEL